MNDSISAYKNFIEILKKDKIPFFPLRYTPQKNNESYFEKDFDYFSDYSYFNTIMVKFFEIAEHYSLSFIINRKKFTKTQIIIFESPSKKITVEIWWYLELKDSSKKMKYIFFEDFISYPGVSSASEMPMEIEALLYLSHLYTKNKSIESESVKERLEYYTKNLQNHQYEQILNLYTELQDYKNIAMTACKANRMLSDRKILRKKSLGSYYSEKKIIVKKRLNRIKNAFLRQKKIYPFIGPDGSGKTTLINSLVAINRKDYKYFRFKKTYRKSFIYKLMFPFLKRTAKKRSGNDEIQKNQVDDYFGNIIFYISKLNFFKYSLFKFFSINKSLTDRYFYDFMFKNLRFDHRNSSMRQSLAKKINTIPKVFSIVNLTAPNAIILKRKKELSDQDLSFYKKEVFLCMLKSRIPLVMTINTSLPVEKCAELINSELKKY